MARYRDLESVSLLGTAITGVQSIDVQGQATEIEYEGDDDAGVQDVGVTGRHFTATVEVKSSDKLRDISDPQWTDKAGSPVTTDLNEVKAVDLSIEGQSLQDDAEDDTWLTYIGVRSVKAMAEARIRDVDQAFGSVFPIGRRGKLTFDMLPPLSTDGLPDSGNAVSCELDNLVLSGVGSQNRHADIAENALRFGGHGSGGAAPAITCSAIPKTAGDTGSLVFTAKSATGGADKTITIANGVLIRLRSRIAKGEIFVVTYELQFYSSDGTTSPLSVA